MIQPPPLASLKNQSGPVLTIDTPFSGLPILLIKGILSRLTFSDLAGVCGTGAAGAFPVRCYYNNDPQGRYVCCDKDGCDGFNPPGNFFPHCKTNGYVPPGV